MLRRGEEREGEEGIDPSEFFETWRNYVAFLFYFHGQYTLKCFEVQEGSKRFNREPGSVFCERSEDENGWNLRSDSPLGLLKIRLPPFQSLLLPLASNLHNDIIHSSRM